MTNQAINWVSAQQALTPDKPFYMYFATGATHAPHHVPKEWIAKYKGKFDGGWDKLREETFARQKKLGVVPADAKLTPRPEGDPRLGRHDRRPEAAVRRARWRPSPASPSTPTTRSAGWSTQLEKHRRSWTTRSSSTSSATTARAPRAGPKAPTTR